MLGLGAGVYLAGTDESIAIDPRPLKGGEHNVIRAELMALSAAISHGSTHIMTDSLSCLHMIANAINTPHDLAYHRYNAILRSIAATLKRQQREVHLYKVASHVGVVGNEKADAIATGVARGTMVDNTREFDTLQQWDGTRSSNTREGTWWLSRRERASAREGEPSARPHQAPLANMHDDLTATAERAVGMGWCDRATVYFAGFASQLRDLHPASFACLTQHRLVSWAQTRLALQYRSGTLTTGKRLHRMKYRHTDACLAGCGQADSIHHAVSTCPLVRDARTGRHNGACLMVLGGEQ